MIILTTLAIIGIGIVLTTVVYQSAYTQGHKAGYAAAERHIDLRTHADEKDGR